MTVKSQFMTNRGLVNLWTFPGAHDSVLCRLADKTDMLERLYDCLTALQRQYEINREDGLYWQQAARSTATQLAMTGGTLLPSSLDASAASGQIGSYNAATKKHLVSVSGMHSLASMCCFTNT